ncbi:MAG: hypothetical protein JSU88_08540 [Nitrospinaceae bacterium]|nr:MAG: hypothetical protein JSU88_08540 [Nitrospinaceae bacterium]
MNNKVKSWEELVNDGENYGGMGKALTPEEKIVFENIKDKKILKLQDRYAFSKTGQVSETHDIELATLIARFEPLRNITTLIITHNNLGPEALKIITASTLLPKVDYLHLGSNKLGDEGAKILAASPMFSKVTTLNLECNGITAEGAKALAASPYLTKVTSLNMVDNRVGDEGALAIAESQTLANLTYLHLGGNRIRSQEAKDALKNSTTLTQLETLKVF